MNITPVYTKKLTDPPPASAVDPQITPFTQNF